MLRDLFGPLAEETSTWQGFKIWLTGYVPLDRDLMHVALGGLILMAVLLVRRSRPALVSALLVAAGLGIGMEVLDRRDDLALGGAWRWWESLSDVALTALVPGIALAWAGRRRRPPPSSGS